MDNYIDEVSQLKYLGIIVDMNLKMGPTCKKAHRKYEKTNTFFFILMNILSKNNIINVYKALIRIVTSLWSYEMGWFI